MARKNHKKGSSKFIQLGHWLYDCPAWQSLKPGPRALYIVLKETRAAWKVAGIDRKRDAFAPSPGLMTNMMKASAEIARCYLQNPKIEEKAIEEILHKYLA